jgi:chromosome partitioning protein
MTAKVISIFNQKGGSGKSTSSMNIAGTLGLRGLRTLVIDMDPQATSSRWYACATEENPFPGTVFSLAQMFANEKDKTVRLSSVLKPHMENFDVIVIDCPPAIESPIPSSAMLVSDLAIIPIIPAPVDMWAAVAAQQLALNVKEINQTLEIRTLANMTQKNTKMARDVIAKLERNEEIPLFKTRIGLRSAFRDSQIIGQTVHKVQGASQAIIEIESLVEEIINILNNTGVK